ncbi:uncharacterized protein LOC133840141 [Drosophila sulfurigaster albostrigata]|uniref:uncharacterized protein LOC133840141 n=1 Tax=Drosophila sulfurigaster albostrigata TaxID=89887 RepID=UPI002D218C19|nr:uncharacterized protein LOC133840141 [Drosophila sulfurigaster albostrigata]
MKSFNNFRIIGNLTRNTVIIVNIKDPPLDAGVSHFLPRLLKDLNELHIVFITELDPSTWQRGLFIYCFEEGFVNALIIYNQNGTTTLHSYNPYPEIQELKVSHIEEFVNRQQLLRNFHHFQIRTVSLRVEPRMLYYTNRKGQHMHAGYMHAVMLEFIKRYNGTLNILRFKDHLSIGHIAEEMLATKKIDFICHPKEPKWNISGTVPLYILKDYILVPHAQPIASYWYFAQPFTRKTWLAVIAIVAYGIIMFYVSSGFERSEFGVHLLSSWCHLLFLPQPRVFIINWQQSVIHFILILGGFVLTNMYISVLKSMLTSGLFEPQANTLEDLIHAPYRLITDKYYAVYFKNATSVPDEVIDNAFVVPTDELDFNRANLNTSFMYIVYEDRMDGLLYQQHLLKAPRFKRMPESIMDGLMSIPVASSLPYLNMLNIYLSRIFEYGIFHKMKNDAYMSAIDSGLYKLMRNEDDGLISYDLNFYFFPIVLWGIGLTCAGLSFLLELLRWRMA